MVYSLFLAKKFIKEDVVIIYGDIVFDHKIYTLLKSKKYSSYKYKLVKKLEKKNAL